ncbi:hypothetical protein, partial [Nocardia otitidiscaviarum]
YSRAGRHPNRYPNLRAELPLVTHEVTKGILPMPRKLSEALAERHADAVIRLREISKQGLWLGHTEIADELDHLADVFETIWGDR